MGFEFHATADFPRRLRDAMTELRAAALERFAALGEPLYSAPLLWDGDGNLAEIPWRGLWTAAEQLKSAVAWGLAGSGWVDYTLADEDGDFETWREENEIEPPIHWQATVPMLNLEIMRQRAALPADYPSPGTLSWRGLMTAPAYGIGGLYQLLSQMRWTAQAPEPPEWRAVVVKWEFIY